MIGRLLAELNRQLDADRRRLHNTDDADEAVRIVDRLTRNEGRVLHLTRAYAHGARGPADAPIPDLSTDPPTPAPRPSWWRRIFLTVNPAPFGR